jgi:hypothetical protein
VKIYRLQSFGGYSSHYYLARLSLEYFAPYFLGNLLPPPTAVIRPITAVAVTTAVAVVTTAVAVVTTAVAVAVATPGVALAGATPVGAVAVGVTNSGREGET